LLEFLEMKSNPILYLGNLYPKWNVEDSRRRGLPIYLLF
jgi:hypothetical protein